LVLAAVLGRFDQLGQKLHPNVVGLQQGWVWFQVAPFVGSKRTDALFVGREEAEFLVVCALEVIFFIRCFVLNNLVKF
jgi:hypothetical protein